MRGILRPPSQEAGTNGVPPTKRSHPRVDMRTLQQGTSRRMQQEDESKNEGHCAAVIAEKSAALMSCSYAVRDPRPEASHATL